jgi:hypothetical protein
MCVVLLSSISLFAQNVTISDVYNTSAQWTNQYQLLYALCSHCHYDEKGAMTYILHQDSEVNNVIYKPVYCQEKGALVFEVPYSGPATYSNYGAEAPSFLGLLRLSNDSIFFTNKSWTNGYTDFYIFYPLDSERYLYSFDSSTWNSGIAQPLLNVVPKAGPYGGAISSFMCYDNGAGFTYNSLSNPFGLPQNLLSTCFDMNVYLGISGTSISDNETYIYPNPNTGHTLTVVTHRQKKVLYVIFCDATGREVKRFYLNNSSGKETLTTDFSPGLYFAKIIFKDGTSSVKRFVQI